MLSWAEGPIHNLFICFFQLSVAFAVELYDEVRLAVCPEQRVRDGSKKLLRAFLPADAVKVIADVQLCFYAIQVLDGKASHDAVRSLQVIIKGLVGHVNAFALFDHGFDDEVILHALALSVTKLFENLCAVDLVPGHGAEHAVIRLAEQKPEVLVGDLLAPWDLVMLVHVAVLFHVIIFADHEVSVVLSLERKQRLEIVRLDVVIAVDEADEIALANVKSCISGRRKAAIILVDHLNAVIHCSIIVTDLRAAVRRSVIHQDQFEILVGLSSDGIYALCQICLNLKDGHDHGNQLIQSNHPLVISEVKSSLLPSIKNTTISAFNQVKTQLIEVLPQKFEYITQFTRDSDDKS